MNKFSIFIFIVLFTALLLCGCEEKPAFMQITDNIEAGEAYDLLKMVCLENKDSGLITVVDDNVNINQVGNYVIKYKATTPRGKEYFQEFTVGVVDTIAPVIESKDEIEVKMYVQYDILNEIKAHDNIDGDITNNIIIDHNITTEKEDTYKINVSVNDSSGNTTTKEITINVTNPYNKEIRFAARGIVTLRNMLKDPSSMQIHKIVYTYVESMDIECVNIDVSAKNGFGGTSRDEFIATTWINWLSMVYPI